MRKVIGKVLCISNRGYEISLTIGKKYSALGGKETLSIKMIRVIDDSGEDYLYPAELFSCPEKNI